MPDSADRRALARHEFDGLRHGLELVRVIARCFTLDFGNRVFGVWLALVHHEPAWTFGHVLAHHEDDDADCGANYECKPLTPFRGKKPALE